MRAAQVVDLTGLVAANSGNILCKPLIAAAGTDISHWFDAKTSDVRLHVDVLTGLEIPFTPNGRFLHCPPAAPRADFSTDFGVPWWKVGDWMPGLALFFVSPSVALLLCSCVYRGWRTLAQPGSPFLGDSRLMSDG